MKDRFNIRPISFRMAMRVVVEKHYLHRRGPCSVAFGLFCNTSDKLLGVITYGTPSSSPLRSGVCGPEEKDNVIELTRLWIDDIAPKNSESFFISNTVKRVNKEIVVSFAEIDAGHVGTVYQAANWIYTGLSAKRTNWNIEGVSLHGQTIADKYKTSDAIKAAHGNKFSLVDRPRKHRYIYFNTNRKRRRQLLGQLRYPILPYPKNNI